MSRLDWFIVTFLIVCLVTAIVNALIRERKPGRIALHAARFFVWTVVGIAILSAVVYLLGWAFIRKP